MPLVIGVIFFCWVFDVDLGLVRWLRGNAPLVGLFLLLVVGFWFLLGDWARGTLSQDATIAGDPLRSGAVSSGRASEDGVRSLDDAVVRLEASADRVDAVAIRLEGAADRLDAAVATVERVLDPVAITDQGACVAP